MPPPFLRNTRVSPLPMLLAQQLAGSQNFRSTNVQSSLCVEESERKPMWNDSEEGICIIYHSSEDSPADLSGSCCIWTDFSKERERVLIQ